MLIVGTVVTAAASVVSTVAVLKYLWYNIGINRN
jgi:hypothetical protein